MLGKFLLIEFIPLIYKYVDFVIAFREWYHQNSMYIPSSSNHNKKMSGRNRNLGPYKIILSSHDICFNSNSIWTENNKKVNLFYLYSSLQVIMKGNMHNYKVICKQFYVSKGFAYYKLLVRK